MLGAKLIRRKEFPSRHLLWYAYALAGYGVQYRPVSLKNNYLAIFVSEFFEAMLVFLGWRILSGPPGPASLALRAVAYGREGWSESNVLLRLILFFFLVSCWEFLLLIWRVRSGILRTLGDKSNLQVHSACALAMQPPWYNYCSPISRWIRFKRNLSSLAN